MKLDTLKLLDSEMLGLIDEGELTSEIEQADAFKEGMRSMVGICQTTFLTNPIPYIFSPPITMGTSELL